SGRSSVSNGFQTGSPWRSFGGRRLIWGKPACPSRAVGRGLSARLFQREIAIFSGSRAGETADIEGEPAASLGHAQRPLAGAVRAIGPAFLLLVRVLDPGAERDCASDQHFRLHPAVRRQREFQDAVAAVCAEACPEEPRRNFLCPCYLALHIAFERDA